ncbi:MAG: TRCF domain-containing protein, partial [Armatimonadota bacterium]
GLAQLYQLRGRVGRSNRQAYCYLMYRYPDRLTPEAEQRLRAIQDFSELGSGFKVALRDLEIRGAGDILGAEQHGHIAAVGFDLYCRMLEEAIRTLRGEGVAREAEVTLDLPVEAVIPGTLVPDESQRIALYRRIWAVRSDQDADDVRAEIQDRYGEVPPPVENLIRTAALRQPCREVGIQSIIGQARRVVVRLRPEAALNRRESAIFSALYQRGPLRAVLPQATFAGEQISFWRSAREDEEVFRAVEEIITRLRYRDDAVAVRVQKGSSRARRAS